MRRPCLFAAGLVASLVALVFSSSSLAGASTSPAALYRASLAAARKQTSVHYYVESKGDSNVETTIGDAGRSVGTKEITIDQKGVSGHVTIHLVGKVAYLEGDDTGLVDLGFSATTAPKAANHWISVPSSDRGYAALSGGMTFASAVEQITMRAPFTFVKKLSRGGVSVDELHVTFGTSGKTPADYYVQTKGQHLPEGYQLSEKDGRTVTVGIVKLSNWNERVTVVAPATSIPISTYGL